MRRISVLEWPPSCPATMKTFPWLPALQTFPKTSPRPTWASSSTATRTLAATAETRGRGNKFSQNFCSRRQFLFTRIQPECRWGARHQRHRPHQPRVRANVLGGFRGQLWRQQTRLQGIWFSLLLYVNLGSVGHLLGLSVSGRVST